MNAIFLDTSGLFCLHHRDEIYHFQAKDYFNNVKQKVTHSYVLSEFVALAQARRLPRLSALSYILDIVTHPDLQTIWVDRTLHDKAMTLLKTRLDKTYSLCDAVSFVVMQQLLITDALTTDHHFTQAGFQQLLTLS